MRGGLRKIKNTTSFESVVNMIMNEKSKITPFVLSSKFGFIIKVDIETPDKLDFEFNGLSDDKRSFNKPISTIIIKMSITSNPNPIQITPDYSYKGNTYTKYTDSLDNIFKEAKTQQNVYLESIQTTYQITPALADFSYLNSAASINLLNAIYKKSTSTTDIKFLVNYLRDYMKLHTNYCLTLLTM